MFTQCSLNVHSMFTQCSLNVHEDAAARAVDAAAIERGLLDQFNCEYHLEDDMLADCMDLQSERILRSEPPGPPGSPGSPVVSIYNTDPASLSYIIRIPPPCHI
jgi:hypothetical protein